MNESFHQIKLSEDSIKYAGFYYNLYVPYGISVSSAAFQRAIDMVLKGMKYIDVISFIDDLVIPGDFEIHFFRLEKVLDKQEKFGFTLRAKAYVCYE